MFARVMFFRTFITWILINIFSTTNAITYSDRDNYDAYGTLVASTDHFVVLAQNDLYRYAVSMAPFGMQYFCAYDYAKSPPMLASNNFVINVATGRRQNSSQLFFVYFQTNSTIGGTQKLGIFSFSRETIQGSNGTTCSRRLGLNQGEREIKAWNDGASEMSLLKVDLYAKYAYGFLSKNIFIYDIENSSVKFLQWNDVLPSTTLQPMAVDIGQTHDGISIAILAGYYQIDMGKSLPAVYLLRLNPPNNMSLITSYIIQSNDQQFVQGRYTSSYNFDYVMSVSIHDDTQQVIVALPQLKKTVLFAFSSTNLTLINQADHPARSTVWLDKNGTQVGLLLSNEAVLPWAQSRIEIFNITSKDISYVYPNNQQELMPWSTQLPSFLRLTVTYDYQPVILTTDGTIILVPLTEAGYFMSTSDINAGRKIAIPCPAGTYKSIRGTTPCTICPPGTKSLSNEANQSIPTIICTACSTDSFCPLASVADIDASLFQSISQAYAYPSSPTTTSFDDILMQNTFSLSTQPVRCLMISPFFWALITLIIAFIILIVMGFLYYSPKGTKHFDRLKCFFRHSDLVGNGEAWFGGLVSFAIVVLIIYGFAFGSVFVTKYPIETSTDAEFACDTSLRNAQFSSLLQLLATIKSTEEEPIFKMLDTQKFTMNVTFIQTGYTCKNVATQENIGTYSVKYPLSSCTQSNNSTLSVRYDLVNHQMTIQINLTGLYYVGGVLICLTGPSSQTNDSSYIVQELNYCESFHSGNQTLGQTTEFYFAMTKIINRTDFLDYSSSSNYSGIWIPTVTHGALDDHVMLDQRGAFSRYLYTQHTIIVRFSETQFYVSNSQQPISRMGEVIFHNILFTTTILGIFALAFLIFKLTFMPIIKCIIKNQMCLIRFCKFKKKHDINNKTVL